KVNPQRKRARFSKEFKVEAVRLLGLGQKPAAQLAVRKLPQSVDSKNWTFLAGFYAGGKSDEEVTVHRIAAVGDTQGRGSGGAGGAAGAQARDQHGDLLPLEVEVRWGERGRAQAVAGAGG